MHTITLSLSGGTWYAIHSDPMILDLMGTDTLPTPFSGSTSAETVRGLVAALNPGVAVQVTA